MTSPNQQPNWQHRLEQLEREINQKVEESPYIPTQKLENVFTRLQVWYQTLPTPAKVAVAIGGVFLVLSLLNTVLKLVTSLISLAILAVILYGVYRLVMTPKSSE